jgi:SPP1 family predicted phage head-tail adaptor
MRAGRLRHRLTLQSRTETRSATGSVTTAWATEDTVWGAIEPLSGKEYLALAQTQNETAVRIVVRYYSGLDESWRVVSGGKAYSIQSLINHDERDHMITLMCSQGVAEQHSLPSSGAENVVSNGVLVVNSNTQVVYTA